MHSENGTSILSFKTSMSVTQTIMTAEPTLYVQTSMEASPVHVNQDTHLQLGKIVQVI